MKTENEIIANFMGWVHSDDPYIDAYQMKNLTYHSDWNELMRVVDKIEGLGRDHKVIIEGSRCRIKAGKNTFKVHTIVRINSVHRCILQFIEFYGIPVQK